MDRIAFLQSLLSGDPQRLAALRLVASLGLNDCWIAAGFVRDAVWDRLHGYPITSPQGDVDVIWFDEASNRADIDRDTERDLQGKMPDLNWSVKNQARMHHRNQDAPYASSTAAMQHWPETATAIAARIANDGSTEVSAPLGLDDLFDLRLRPGPRFFDEKRPIFDERIKSKRWIARYPKLSRNLTRPVAD